ncbi:MAG: ThiF family adenylyltransferase [Eubacteriales bacterium]
MANAWQEREISLIGQDAVDALGRAHAAVFGAGGVGGHVVEGLCRAGFGAISVVDRDTFADSNLNRQILCTRANIGQPKAQAALERILSINPECRARGIVEFVTPENVGDVLNRCFETHDGECADTSSHGVRIVVDAIDNVTAKIALIEECSRRGIYVVSCMGTGNKLDPMAFKLADIKKTSVCPLARVMRRELGARGISCDVVYSEESPHCTGLRTPASISYVPAAAAMLLCSASVSYIAGAGMRGGN